MRACSRFVSSRRAPNANTEDEIIVVKEPDEAVESLRREGLVVVVVRIRASARTSRRGAAVALVVTRGVHVPGELKGRSERHNTESVRETELGSANAATSATRGECGEHDGAASARYWWTVVHAQTVTPAAARRAVRGASVRSSRACGVLCRCRECSSGACGGHEGVVVSTARLCGALSQYHTLALHGF